MADDPAKEILQAARARSLGAKARLDELTADIMELEVERDRDKRKRELAANEHHHVYVFDSDVSDSSVKRCVAQLTEWSREDDKCPMEIQINSPGGVIFSGFALIDFIRGLRAQGHRVTMVTYGMAASMGGVLLQAADVRVMGENAFMLIHEGSLGAIGDFGDVEDRVELMKQMHDRILTLFEDRAKPLNPRTTKTFIRNRWKRRDWWMTAPEAKKLGFIDEIR